ncbi:hypothetical protein PNF28_25030, partial [Escherichia coli]|nr:hypothetical protein [Escherichia coli]
MNNSAFTFQTLHPDTIMDALFEHGIRVDSGLTPLNSLSLIHISEPTRH